MMWRLSSNIRFRYTWPQPSFLRFRICDHRDIGR